MLVNEDVAEVASDLHYSRDHEIAYVAYTYVSIGLRNKSLQEPTITLTPHVGM